MSPIEDPGFQLQLTVRTSLSGIVRRTVSLFRPNSPDFVVRDSSHVMPVFSITSGVNGQEAAAIPGFESIQMPKL